MSRFYLWLASAAFVAAGVVGCAHCDICDDLPTPCYGPNCPYGPGFGGPSYGGPGPMPASSVNSMAPNSGGPNPPQNPETMPAGPAPNPTPEPSGSADPGAPIGPVPPVGLGRP